MNTRRPQYCNIKGGSRGCKLQWRVKMMIKKYHSNPISNLQLLFVTYGYNYIKNQYNLLALMSSLLRTADEYLLSEIAE